MILAFVSVCKISGCFFLHVFIYGAQQTSLGKIVVIINASGNRQVKVLVSSSGRLAEEHSGSFTEGPGMCVYHVVVVIICK